MIRLCWKCGVQNEVRRRSHPKLVRPVSVSSHRPYGVGPQPHATDYDRKKWVEEHCRKEEEADKAKEEERRKAAVKVLQALGKGKGKGNKSKG
uniref:Uncharacterized protein n=1 Tax=Chromera velia CCMP2878 TaxID=1169474 RepID=A0A0G4I929_9ALVE|eukprot:Cvel_12127.t1-p1 / transcript=Cvel_12127.t1 / gene=Cvel_12127 / organism=Chromera_velia_CCMP2878 / gene_product=hypothetical protein / transcript_product=hypothetical protein / location=Cvel_scaffold781:29984-32007(+) / protein_length=92 / sequence_SO=supercontig / SO=protein_coding / is_pseudo=false